LDKIVDIIIIGAGPTGISCAIQAKKAGLHYLILEKGVLVNSLFHFPVNMTFFSTSQKLEIADVPFISINDKPTRAEALEYYRRLVTTFSLEIKYRHEVLSIDQEDNVFSIGTTKGMFFANNIIVCTGYYDCPRLLNIPGENLPKVKHYYDEAHRYIDQKVVVIGGANSACDVALETLSKGAEVTMVVRGRELYQKVKYWILPNVENRIKEGSIKAYFNSEVVEIREDTVKVKTPDGLINLENDYILAMSGYIPDYDFLEKCGITISTDEAKIPNHNISSLESNVKNLYVAGVINSGMYTSKLFIENTRHHAELIVNDILLKTKNSTKK
jgi:thioredoxin reductase (NADPH)